MNADILAKTIWEYHLMGHRLEKADGIIVLGSHDTRVAERGAQILLEGWAPWVVFSGYLGSLTLGVWTRPEAEIFAEIALQMGVPPDKILIENKATNTNQNIAFSKNLLAEKGIHPQKIIAVQKPYMERRTYATFKKVWPEPEVIIASPLIRFEDYPNEKISKDEMLNVMVGDLQRIMIYPGKGYQIPQEVPDDVVEAFEGLVAMGYNKHLIKE